MITRPSISELIDGLVRNLEHSVQDTSGSAIHSHITPMLTTLDRLGHEWSGWSATLAIDNADIQQTLARIGAEPESNPKSDLSAQLASRNSLLAVEQLEEENRVLKAELVAAMATFDLPADADGTAEQKQADKEVLGLLRRMLMREAEVKVAPPRSSPTSGNPSNASLSLDGLAEILYRYLSAQLPTASLLDIKNLQTLAGGASREAWTFDVSWRVDNEPFHEECILMREPISSVLVSDASPKQIDGTRRTVEIEVKVIKALEAVGLPVAHVLWADTQGVWLERPFSISRRLPGTADVGPVMGTDLAEPLLEQYIEILTRIHKLDPITAGVEYLGTPSALTAASEQIRLFEHNFHSQRMEEFPATSYMIAWLKKFQPRASRVSVVHGDYRLGNFLYQGDQIVAILDWEQVHVGDPIEELAFMYWDLWSLASLCPIEEFVCRYEAAMGDLVNRQTLAYYRVFIEFKMLVVLFTGLKSYFATPEYQIHYGGAQTTEMIRDAQMRVIEELLHGGPTVAFDAYHKAVA